MISKHNKNSFSSATPEGKTLIGSRSKSRHSSISLKRQTANKFFYSVPVVPQIVKETDSKDILKLEIYLDFTQGCEAYSREEYEEAKIKFQKVSEKYPTCTDSLINSAVCEIQMKELKKAEEILKKACEQDPYNEFISFNKAYISAIQGNHEKALEELNFLKTFSTRLINEVSKLRTFSIINCGKLSPLLKPSDSSSLKSNRPCYKNEVLSSKVILLQNPSRKSSHFSIKDKFDFLTLMPTREKILSVQENLTTSQSPPKSSASPVKQYSSPQKPRKNSIGQLSSISKIQSKLSIYRLDKKDSRYDLLQYSKESNKSNSKLNEKSKILATNEVSGLYQKDLSNLNSKRVFDSEEKEKSREEKMESIRKKVTEYFNYQINKTEYKDPAPASSSITEQEIKFLILQFSVDPALRSYDQIDEIMLKLDFFQKYQQEIRLPLYQFSCLKYFRAGSIIFNQGDIGDNLYIIVKGSVTVIKSTEDFRNHPVAVNSLYSGQHFGDIALIHALKSNPFSNRTATIQTSESSHLLVVPKANYQDLLLNLQVNLLQDKTVFLSKLKIFTGVDAALLIPLACNLHSKKFALGEVIFNKGNVPEGVFIVYKGQVKLVTTGVMKRKVGFAEIKANLKQAPKFVCNKYAGVGRKKVKSCGFIEEMYSKSQDSADFTGNQAVKDEILYCQMFPGDYCAGRSIVAEDVQPSKFSMVANSPSTEVLVLTKGHLFYLAESFQENMKIVLRNSFEIDCPSDVDPRFMDKFFKDWQVFRKGMVEHIQQVNYYEQHKFF